MKRIFILSFISIICLDAYNQVVPKNNGKIDQTIVVNTENAKNGIFVYSVATDATGTVISSSNPTFVKTESFSLVDEVSTDTTYLGYAIRGTSSTASDSFKIVRIVTVGTITSKQYAGGNENFDKIWNNRASYIYKY